MKLCSGSVIINRDIKAVYAFCREYSNFVVLMPEQLKDEYEIEIDDDLSGPMNEGDEFAIYFFANYEGKKDFVADTEICKLRENGFLVFKIKRFSAYENEDDEYEDVKPVPYSQYLGYLEFGVIYDQHRDGTKVTFITYVYPNAPIKLKLISWFFSLIGRFTSRDYYQRWKQTIERNI